MIAGFALRRPRPYDFLLTMAGLGLALQSVRHVALFVAAATPVMVGTYSEYWRELSSSRGWKFPPLARPLFAVITAVVLVFIFAVALVKIDANIGPSATKL